jgi:phospholipid/cholesterol/gamma-HCH transport system substrate-binding protein
MELATARIGILGIIVLACVLSVFWMIGNTHWFTNETRLHLLTSDSAGLNEEASVRINGIVVGRVTNISFSGTSNPQQVVKIDFNVDENMLREIPIDSIASINSAGPLSSTKFLEINKGRSKQTVRRDATLKAADTRQLEHLVQQGYKVLDSAQLITAKVADIVGQVEVGKGTFGKVAVDESFKNSLRATVNQIQLLNTTLNSQRGVFGHLANDEALRQRTKNIIKNVDDLKNGVQAGQGTVGMFLKDRKLDGGITKNLTQLNANLANLKSTRQLLVDDKFPKQLSTTFDKLNRTIDKIHAGEGTLGQLSSNPSLHDSIDGTTRELHEIIKDFRTNPKNFIQLHVF